MNTYWSTYVQESRELYHSRALRFHDGNKDLWLKTMQIQNGMKVLDVGCGSGIFCHRVKKYLPSTQVTGLDFDLGHIEFAKAKALELNLDCTFIAGDATDLPFSDTSFDLCYSHTIINLIEPIMFIKEQYRVLKPEGKIVILCVINNGNEPEQWTPDKTCEEKELFDGLWNEADKNKLSQIKKYDASVSDYCRLLDKYGFKNISAEAMAVVDNAPDFSNINRQMAIDQINDNRLTELCSSEKARRMAPEALSEAEFKTLLEMINRRYDKRIEQYNRGERLWEYHVSTVLAISGSK